MSGRTARITAETWIDTARRTLIEEGIAGVKVDRLASRLGVTRGGFYHAFKDREDLLERLLAAWERDCRFLAPEGPGTTPVEAVGWIEHIIHRLIEEDGYDPQFDMAVREWARSDQRAAWAVERADRERVSTFERYFRALGYDPDEAQIRARVFYYHQIGYYTIGVRQSIAERRRNARMYVDIICGPERMAKARARAAPDQRKLRAPA